MERGRRWIGVVVQCALWRLGPAAWRGDRPTAWMTFSLTQSASRACSQLLPATAATTTTTTTSSSSSSSVILSAAAVSAERRIAVAAACRRRRPASRAHNDDACCHDNAGEHFRFYLFVTRQSRHGMCDGIEHRPAFVTTPPSSVVLIRPSDKSRSGFVGWIAAIKTKFWCRWFDHYNNNNNRYIYIAQNSPQSSDALGLAL